MQKNQILQNLINNPDEFYSKIQSLESEISEIENQLSELEPQLTNLSKQIKETQISSVLSSVLSADKPGNESAQLQKLQRQHNTLKQSEKPLKERLEGLISTLQFLETLRPLVGKPQIIEKGLNEILPEIEKESKEILELLKPVFEKVKNVEKLSHFFHNGFFNKYHGFGYITTNHIPIPTNRDIQSLQELYTSFLHGTTARLQRLQEEINSQITNL